MPRIPIESGGGEIEFKFIPKSNEGDKPKATPKKSGVKRSDFEKFIRLAAVIVVAFLIVSHFIKKETTPSYLSASVSLKRVKEPDRVKAEIKPIDGYPDEAWSGAKDINKDGIIDAWEGIEQKRIEYYSRGNNENSQQNDSRY